MRETGDESNLTRGTSASLLRITDTGRTEQSSWVFWNPTIVLVGFIRQDELKERGSSVLDSEGDKDLISLKNALRTANAPAPLFTIPQPKIKTI